MKKQIHNYKNLFEKLSVSSADNYKNVKIGNYLHSISPNIDNIIDYQPMLEQYYFRTILNEAGGIFEPLKISAYRSALTKISLSICKDIKNKPVERDVFIHQNPDEPNWCKTFIFSEEFKNVPLINKLQIFVSSADSYNGIAMVANRYSDNEIAKYNPSFEIIDNSINVCSIILYIKTEDYQDLHLQKNLNYGEIAFKIRTVLQHEMMHLLHCLWNVNYIIRANNALVASDNVKQKLSELNFVYPSNPENLVNLFQAPNITVDELAVFICQCLYYTAETEIYAHVETVINELKLKNAEYTELSDDNIASLYLMGNSKTYNYINTLVKSGELLLKKYDSFISNKTDDNLVDLFWELIQAMQLPNHKITQISDFKKQIKNWLVYLRKFQKQLCKAAKTYNKHYGKI